MTDSKDTLGDRLKEVEQAEAGRKAVKGKPIMARLDGRAFHTFTKGLNRPYDERMSALMIGTTKYLVEETHALVGYTQSDEISLCYYVEEDNLGTYLFDGKFQKLTSVLASLATSYFTKNLPGILPEKQHTYPTFDCRVWQVEDLNEAYLNYLWRQQDAVKNAISMAAQAHFSSRKLHGVDGEGKKKMLEEIGHPFDDMPAFFKHGTFVHRVTKEVELTSDQMAKIPEAHRPTGPVLRSCTETTFPELKLLVNPNQFLFGDKV
jgi:tRNA(His) 5'-end guanylyltransferase